MAIPILAQHCATGKTLPKAKLEFMRADGDGKRVKYYEVELENVLISKCQQRIAGGAGGNTAGGWDLAANRVAA